MDKAAVYHQNALLKDILLSKDSHGGLFKLNDLKYSQKSGADITILLKEE
jgi:hypothetical protein